MVPTEALAQSLAGLDVAALVLKLENLKQWKAQSGVLKSTGIGKEVAKLKKHSDQQVALMASELVAKWRQDISSVSASVSNDSLVDAKSTNIKPDVVPTYIPKAEPKPIEPRQKPKQLKRKADSQLKQVKYHHEDPVRLKSLQLLHQALNDDLSDQVESVVRDIEAEVYGLHPYTPKDTLRKEAYSSQIRTLFLNIRQANKSGSQLQSLILRREGRFAPDKLVRLTPSQLQPSVEEENKKIKQELLKEAKELFSQKKVATTDQFQCGKCKERKVSYYQLQTRSADEPMTNFCECTNCGNRWKFC